MNKIIFSFFASLLVCLFSSCIQSNPTSKTSLGRDKTVMLHWLDLDDKGIVRLTGNDGNLSKSSKPFSGEAIETFEQSPTKSVSQWKEGKKDGITTEYFYNGRKRRIIEYKNGIKNGNAEEYRITGDLLRQETYQNGELNGPKSEWHPNGAKILEVQMKNDKPHGEVLEWYTDGIEKSSTIYRHGLREGPSSEWYPNGQRKLGLFYQKDKQHGKRTIWYEDGQKRLTAIFEEDMMEGNSQGWFTNGQQQFDYNFKKNLEHGICTEWDSSGNKISEIRFVDGTPTQNLLTGEKISAPDVKVEDPAPTIPVLNPSNQGVFAPPANVSVDRKEPQSKPSPIPVNEPVLENPEQFVAPLPPPSIPPKGSSNSIKLPEFEVPHAPPTPSLPKGITNELKTSPPNSPSFNPFEDEPLKPKVNSIQPSALEVPISPPPPPSFNPFEDKPAQTIQPEVSFPSDSPPPPSFNPFEDKSLPQTPDFFEEEKAVPPPPPPPVNVNPFDLPGTESIPQVENAPFDPFASEDSESKNNNSTDIPLGDVFNTPSNLDSPADSNFDNIPPPPPPPPTFNPFDLPPLPGE